MNRAKAAGLALATLCIGTTLLTACSGGATTHTAATVLAPVSTSSVAAPSSATTSAGPDGHALAVAACTDLAASGQPGGGGLVQRNRGYAEAQRALQADPSLVLGTDWQTVQQTQEQVQQNPATGADVQVGIAALNEAIQATQAVVADCAALGVAIPDHSF